jgi:hypothetical protein
MIRAECPIINAIGNWVLRSIHFDDYSAPVVKPIQMQARPALPSQTVRQKILAQMDKSPVITTDSTPVAPLSSPKPYYIRTEYNPEAEKSKDNCVNTDCPAYFRYAGIACLGCQRKYWVHDFWGLTHYSS